MSLLKAVTSAQTQTPAKADKPKSEFWLNVGVQVGDQFISLPFGLALDDMKIMDAKGNNQEWIQTVQAKNALLQALQGTAAGLESGSSVVISELQVQLLRASKPESTSNGDDNPLVAAILAQLGK